MTVSKIGIITHNFPFYENDRKNAGVFVLDLAKELSKGMEVIVLAPGPEEKVKLVSGVKTYFFKFPGKLGSLKIYNPVHIVKFFDFFIQGKKSLRLFLKQNKNLDFIISMWAYPGGFFAYNSYKSKKIPYAIYALGSDIYFYAKKPFLKQSITKYLKDAKFLLADSPDLVREVNKLSGKKTSFLPSVSKVNFRVNKRKEKSKRISLTFLGRLEKVKGVDIFMKALNSLDEELEKFKINIVGDGSLGNYLKQNLSAHSDIKFWGNLDAKRIAELLNKTDWLVIPSRSDSIPLVFSEAMKFSVPVIVSDLPDLKYLVKKYQVGHIFKNEDSSSLAEVLIQIIYRDKNAELFKRNTKKAAAFFDLEKTSDKLQKLIRKYV